MAHGQRASILSNRERKMSLKRPEVSNKQAIEFAFEAEGEFFVLHSLYGVDVKSYGDWAEAYYRGEYDAYICVS